MAVATASTSAARMESPQLLDPSPSKLSPESSLSSSPTASGAAESFDRCNSSNSSPNPCRDAEILSPDILKSEEYRQLFRLPPEEVLIEDYNCALQENILIQGHMYLFVHFICFYSNIFGFETKKIIPFNEVTSVRRAKTAGIFHNAIEIFAGGKKHFFASFLSRDEAFKIINDLWSQQGDGARAITEEQESMPESSTHGNGSIAIENVKISDDLDNESSSADMSKDTNPCKESGIPSNSENFPVTTTVSEQQSIVKEGAESVSNNNASTMAWNWKEDDTGAPKIPEVYTIVAESKFLIKVEDFFRYFFSDEAVNFLESFHKRCGDKDFKCTSWRPQEKFGYAREFSFQHPIKLYLGAKFGGCHGTQKYRVYKNSHLVIETTQEVSDVPYADYFRVEALWDVERDRDESRECCILRVYVNVEFSKKTIWKGKIVQSTIDECRDAYAIWVGMAHESLKQKNLEKQEECGATAVVTQNEEVNLDSEVNSESSPETRNPTSTRVIPDALDVKNYVSNHLRGSFIDTASIPSLLREVILKFRTSLKNQSHLSLLLVIIFALIFFMQFSILMLLARPQHIHVSTPLDYMNQAENGVGRSSSADIAWLEKRVHHLKDEMYMVESRLERMRYEHALLKKQLKDLERR
ncbi:hypothetical protein L6164_000639 [Bauhinia variegata]|uniref:Uncharacterized protein n=1 Tax=Bauhinia variegata TaxID=167791 RepID=A0ACB9QCZ4_BAUVA|nr:hypothetical protein L6164_000639 [Bauhinia variegata]